MNNIEYEGFFKNFYLTVFNTFNDELLNNFGNLESDEERFKFVNNLKIVKTLKLQPCVSLKNAITALKFKQKGNISFQEKNYKYAIDFYNKSQMEMPPENETDIAIILANRSAALYHLELYDLALKDIDLATQNYPKDMLHKLKERKARCHLAKKEYTAAFESFKETITYLDISKIPFEKRGKLEKDSQIMIKLLPKQVEMEQKSKISTKQSKLMENKEETDTTSFTLNGNVTFDYNKSEGRFAKAKNNIKVGENLLIEKPHCVMLLQKYCRTHCQHCFIRTIAPLACYTCTNVIFCSKECRDVATSTYHKFECKILPILWRSGSSINCHMALRMISQKSMEYFESIKLELIKKNPIGLEVIKKYTNDDYQKVYNLVRHEQSRKPSSYLQYSIMAYFLMECLNLVNFCNSENPQYDFIGGLILRNLQFLQFNTHEIAELQKSSNKKMSKTEFIGGGLYPTLALFNHSCDPGIVRYYKGNTVFVHAIKNVSSGNIIAENYGPLYSQNPKNDRQLNLKDLYWFDCNCKPCLENWPLYDDMDNSELRFKCDGDEPCDNVITIPIDCNEFMIKCIQCGHFTNILKGLKAVQDTEFIEKTARRLTDEGDYQKAIEKYYEMIKIMSDVMAPPFRDYCNCQQNIKDCLLEKGSIYMLPN